MVKLTTYDRISQKLLADQPKLRQPTASFIDGKLLTGTKSLHRTPAGRRWRTFWRIKFVRPV